MAEADEVEFNGIVFRRYPKSENLADRRYYRPSGDHVKDGVEALHREVWKAHNGEIPDGHHIHHIDGDPTNNDIDNLECVTPKEHAERHPENNLTPEDIRKGVEAAKAWHKSEEGSEWHSEHWENSLGNLFADPKTRECDYCGEEYEYYTSSRFCSNACKSAHRRDSGVDDVEHECVICGETFMANKYAGRETCSKSCGGKLGAKRRYS